MGEFTRVCAGCADPLPPKHLRVQLAPPDDKWHEVRVHDLACLLDFLEDEEEKQASGDPGRIFSP